MLEWKLQTLQKKTSISPRTATRGIEKLTQKHMLDFGIIRDMSSMNLTGYMSLY